MEITIFKNPDFGQVRTIVGDDGEPRFCLKDVCDALDLEGKQVARRLEKGVVSKHPLLTDGGYQQAASDRAGRVSCRYKAG